MNRVNQKVTIVTSGSRGLGRLVCKTLAREGAKVAITDLQDDQGQALAAEIRQMGGDTAYWRLDVANEAQVAQVFQQVVDQWGQVDVLVNHVGLAQPPQALPPAIAPAPTPRLDINLDGVLLCTKHAAAAMLANGEGGSIVNLSAANRGEPAADQATQQAMRLLTQTDALMYAADNIRVNAMYPTASEPAPTAANAVSSCSYLNAIADGVLFLASNESQSTTGTELVIDADAPLPSTA